MGAKVVRVAALADLHCTRNSQGAFQPLFARVAEAADVAVVAGDLTDYGLPEEARVLAKEVAGVRIPIVAGFGHHHIECGQAHGNPHIPIVILDGEVYETQGIGIAGAKGFGGGFGKHALGPWGETIIKEFVREAVDEALRFESALARLRTAHLIGLLHYSPIQQTVDGEPLEIYPFLGSSRLEEPINRYPVSFVVHGHAHRGQLEVATKSGVPVYNGAMPLLTRWFVDRPPFRVFEIPSPVEPGSEPTAIPFAAGPSRGRRATDAVAS